MPINKSRASYKFIHVSLENPENQRSEIAHFNLHLINNVTIKSDFNKVAKHGYGWVFYCKFAACFRNTFS